MSKYNYSATAISEETTKEYIFSGVEGQPSIVIAPAHDANKRFLNYRMQKTVELTQQIKAGTSPTVAAEETTESLIKRAEEDREYDRGLIAFACAVSWGKSPPVAMDGSTPDFSPEECLDFLRALPIEDFDPLRNYANNLYNFKPRPKVTREDADKLGN